MVICRLHLGTAVDFLTDKILVIAERTPQLLVNFPVPEEELKMRKSARM